MHILYVSHSHPPEGDILENVGGMQRVSQQLIRELERNREVKITEATTNVSGNGITVGIETLGFLLKQVMELPTKIRENGVDIVLFSSMVTASLSYFLRNRVSVPMVTINHGRDVTLPNPLYQWFVPKVFASLDGVISVSQATRQECIKRGMDPGKCTALPNGFDFHRLNHYPDKSKSRAFFQEAFKIPLDDKFMLLTVGRKVKRKGHEWFIREVLPKLNNKIVYVTIGDGPEFEKIDQAVQESADNRGKVYLLGRQPDDVLKKAYAAADLFVMPNIPVDGDMEGFGIVLLEANMARTPAIASDLEGIKDVINEGKNGYRVQPLDAEGFARKVNWMLEHDLEQFSEQTRSYVRDHFSWEHVASQYVDYLQSVIER